MHMWSLFQTPLYSIVGRPSSTSSLDRRALKTAASESDRCLALRKSARQTLSQTPSYSNGKTASQDSVARRQIWANGVYTGSVNQHGYSRGAEIFRARDAKIAKEKEAAAKAAAKEQK